MNSPKQPSTDQPAELLELKLLSPQVLGLSFRVSPNYRWQAGQYLWLRWNDKNEETRYPYSIASSQTAAGSLELAISLGGLTEERLNILKKADFELSRLTDGLGRFELSPAEGQSIWHRLGKEPQGIQNISLIGIGTGVAPLRAAYQHLLHVAPDAQIHLLHGVRREEDGLFAEEFQQAATASKIIYKPTLTQGSAEWGGLRGRVQEHLHHFTHCESFYVCGSKEMTENVRSLLVESGVQAEQVVHEGF